MDTRNKRDQFTQPAGARRVTPTTIGGIAIVVLSVALVYMIASGTAESANPAGAAGPPGQDISLDAAQFEDGVARFYTHTTADGRPVRFFVMKSADGVIRAAFDACDTCYREKKGYKQQGTDMICNNCNRSFRSVDINVLQGGCNPAPLDRSVSNGRVLLTATALSAGVGYF